MRHKMLNVKQYKQNIFTFDTTVFPLSFPVLFFLCHSGFPFADLGAAATAGFVELYNSDGGCARRDTVGTCDDGRWVNP